MTCSSSDIKDLIEHYENENAKVDDLIGDPIFIEGQNISYQLRKSQAIQTGLQ